jgi:hypothetical protein
MSSLHEQILKRTEIESVRELLLVNDWHYLCEGDWAWIYLAPDSGTIARLCTFDPAYRLYLDSCLAHPYEVHLPTIQLLHDMPHGSYVTIMECYTPYGDPENATQLCQLLTDHNSIELPEHLRQLKSILSSLHSKAARELFQFGKFDLRPDHIMLNKRGEFVVVDPIFVDGRKLLKSMQSDLSSVLVHYSVEELLNFLKIAAMTRNPNDPVISTLRNELLNCGNQV